MTMTIGTNIYQDIISFDFTELKKEVNTNKGDIIIAYIEDIVLSVFRHSSVRCRTTFGPPIGTPLGYRNKKTGKIDIHLNISPQLLITNRAQRAIKTQVNYLNGELRYIEEPTSSDLRSEFNRIRDLMFESDSIATLNKFPDGIIPLSILDCEAFEEQKLEFGLFRSGKHFYRGIETPISLDPDVSSSKYIIDLDAFAPRKTIKYLESIFPYIKLTLLEQGFIAKTDDIFIKDSVTLKFDSGKILYLVDESVAIKERNMTIEKFTSVEALILSIIRTISKKVSI